MTTTADDPCGIRQTADSNLVCGERPGHDGVHVTRLGTRFRTHEEALASLAENYPDEGWAEKLADLRASTEKERQDDLEYQDYQDRIRGRA